MLQQSQTSRQQPHTQSKKNIPNVIVSVIEYVETSKWQEERRQLLLSTAHYGGILCTICKPELNNMTITLVYEFALYLK